LNKIGKGKIVFFKKKRCVAGLKCGRLEIRSEVDFGEIFKNVTVKRTFCAPFYPFKIIF
jgi:hypothetical protein